MIKNKLKELLSELKLFKLQSLLNLEYKEKNDRKIFHLGVKLIASYSNIDEAFKSMHQRIITKIKNYASEGWVVIKIIVKHSIKILSVSISIDKVEVISNLQRLFTI